jgi:hypothetical protein
MWGKYCRIYPEFAKTKKKNTKKTVLYLKVQSIYESCLFDSPRQNEKHVYII